MSAPSGSPPDQSVRRQVPIHPFCLRGFVSAVAYQGRPSWEGRRVLVCAPPVQAQAATGQFPDAELVLAPTVGRDLPRLRSSITVRVSQSVRVADSLDAAVADRGPYDYIAWVAPPRMESGWEPRLRAVLGALAEGAVVGLAVPGRISRYSCLLVRDVIRRLLAGSPGDPAEVARQVVNGLPRDSFFLRRDEFVMELAMGGGDAFRDLVDLEPGDMLSVPELLEWVAGSGAGFLDWMVPAVYQFSRMVESAELAAAIRDLPPERSARIAELVAAGPTYHAAFVGHPSDHLVAPPWDSPEDLLCWRPVRLPPYDWASLASPTAGVCVLPPFVRTEFFGQVTLKVWHARLCQAADGERSVADLLEIGDIRRAIDEPKSEWPRATAALLREACDLRVLALLSPKQGG